VCYQILATCRTTASRVCYRRESGMAKRNFNKLQEHGRPGWRSRNSKKQVIVSPVCPRQTTAPTPILHATKSPAAVRGKFLHHTGFKGESARPCGAGLAIGLRISVLDLLGAPSIGSSQPGQSGVVARFSP
jgi:hypothetical protein